MKCVKDRDGVDGVCRVVRILAWVAFIVEDSERFVIDNEAGKQSSVG